MDMTNLLVLCNAKTPEELTSGRKAILVFYSIQKKTEKSKNIKIGSIFSIITFHEVCV